MIVLAAAQDAAFQAFLGTFPVAGLSVGSLVLMLLVAFFTERIYPRGIVVAERQRHAKEIADLRAQHSAEVVALREEHTREVKALTENYVAQIAILREDRDLRIGEYQQEVAEWRGAYQGMETALAAVRAQNGELLELARTSEHALRSWPSIEGGRHD